MQQPRHGRAARILPLTRWGCLLRIEQSHINHTSRITHLNRGECLPRMQQPPINHTARITHLNRDECLRKMQQSHINHAARINRLSRHRSILLCRMHPPPDLVGTTTHGSPNCHYRRHHHTCPILEEVDIPHSPPFGGPSPRPRSHHRAAGRSVRWVHHACAAAKTHAGSTARHNSGSSRALAVVVTTATRWTGSVLQCRSPHPCSADLGVDGHAGHSTAATHLWGRGIAAPPVRAVEHDARVCQARCLAGAGG